MPEKGARIKSAIRAPIANPGILREVDQGSPLPFSEGSSPTESSGGGAWTGGPALPAPGPNNSLRHPVNLPPEAEPGEYGGIAGSDGPDHVIGTGLENCKAP